MDLTKYLPVSIVETLAGLFVVLSLLGFATFLVQDWISSLLPWRSALLAATIRNMLADADFTNRFFNHPLIKSLTVQHHKSNYISGKQFAEVLFHLIMSDEPNAKQMSRTKNIGTFEKLTQSLNRIHEKNPALVTAIHTKLLGISDETNIHENKFQEAINRVAEWYDEVMDRLNSAYISRLQLVNLYIALMLAIVLNVDTIAIGNYLWREPLVEQILTAQALSFTLPETMPPQQAKETINQTLSGFSIPLGWSPSAMPQTIGSWVVKLGGIIMSGVIAAIAAPFLRSLLYRKTSYEAEPFFTPPRKKEDD